MTDNLFENDEARATKADDDFYIPTAEVDALPEYEGTTDGDRASYLFENADALAAQAVANARQRIEDRAKQLAAASEGFDEQELMTKLPSLGDTPMKTHREFMEKALEAEDQADYLADQEAAEIIEDKKDAWTKESIAGAAKFMSDLQRAREMRETRQERVSDAVDAAFPVPNNAAD